MIVTSQTHSSSEYVSKTKCKKYKRKIFYLYNDKHKKNLHQYCYIQFIIDDDYVPSQRSHGNSIYKEKPHLQTRPSTIGALREQCGLSKPKRAFENVRKSMGHVNSASECPKNYRQALYAHSSSKFTFKAVEGKSDELLTAIYRCKKPGDSFVLEVQSAPEGIVVLPTDTQITDIERFCGNKVKRECEPLCIDPTFNLGDFYVTVTSYRNKMLKNKNDRHPVHIGPVQIHHRKLTSSYRFLPSSLKRINPSVKNVKIVGTRQRTEFSGCCMS